MFKWIGKKIEKFTTIFHSGVLIESEASNHTATISGDYHPLNIKSTDSTTPSASLSYYVAIIENRKTGRTEGSLTNNGTLLHLLDLDTSINHALSTTTQIGIDLSLYKAIDFTGNCNQTGLKMLISGQSPGILATGIDLTVENEGIDIIMRSSSNSRDYSYIATTANGGTTITTVDADAALAHFEIAADGDITLDSAGQIKLEPVAGNNILLDGTIAVDAGVVTGATSITSTSFVGDLTGDASGSSASCTGQAATVATIAGLAPNTATTQATQASITTCENLTTVGNIIAGGWRGTAIESAYMATATAAAQGAVELATPAEAITGDDTTRAITAAGLKSHVGARYSYQYINFSFKAQNIPPDVWKTPAQEGPEYYLWTNTHGSGETQAASDAPSAVDIETTISVDYLDQTSGFIIPKACVLEGFYGNCKVNNTNPNTLRPVMAFFRAAEPSDGNTSDLTATCVAFDSYDTAGGNRKNRFLKLENSGLTTDLAQGDLLFPAVGFDATAGDSNADIWGSFTIVLKTLIP